MKNIMFNSILAITMLPIAVSAMLKPVSFGRLAFLSSKNCVKRNYTMIRLSNLLRQKKHELELKKIELDDLEANSETLPGYSYSIKFDACDIHGDSRLFSSTLLPQTLIQMKREILDQQIEHTIKTISIVQKEEDSEISKK